jgi:lipopolysaccharide transport protein LptA
MRIFYIVTLLILTGGPALRAQTNNPPASALQITSQTQVSDINARLVTYFGHVRVTDAQMKMTCSQLVLVLPDPGQRVSRIVAETNVVVDFTDTKGQTMHVTGDKAIYSYTVQAGETNETVTLTGHAKMENAQGTQTGEPIVVYLVDNKVSKLIITNPETIIPHQSFGGVNSPTNTPATGTNFPPGTIQNIDKMTIPPTRTQKTF